MDKRADKSPNGKDKNNTVTDRFKGNEKSLSERTIFSFKESTLVVN